MGTRLNIFTTPKQFNKTKNGMMVTWYKKPTVICFITNIEYSLFNNTRVSQKFSNILPRACLRRVYQQFKPWYVSAVLGSIVVVGALTCVLLHSVCDLKITQLNMQRRLIRLLMLYEFEQNHNAAEVTKKISWATGEDAVNRSISFGLLEPRWSDKISQLLKPWIPRLCSKP